MDLNPLEVQQSIPVSHNNESILLSRPSSATRTNISGEI
jgi:hypothetical protein